MNTIHEELDARLSRLERDVRELSTAVTQSRSRQDRVGDAAMNRISSTAWLQITGPTFATLLIGFTLLWNAQQVTTSSLLEVQRSMGRLEGSLGGLDARIEGLGGRIRGLDQRLESLDARMRDFDLRMQSLDVRLDELGDAVNLLTKRLGAS